MNTLADVVAAVVVTALDALLSVCMVADDAVASVRGGVS